MLLPDKHLRLSESILGFAGLVLSLIVTPITFDNLWRRVQVEQDEGKWPASHGTDNFGLALSFLFSIGALDVNPRGELFRCG